MSQRVRAVVRHLCNPACLTHRLPRGQIVNPWNTGRSATRSSSGHVSSIASMTHVGQLHPAGRVRLSRRAGETKTPAGHVHVAPAQRHGLADPKTALLDGEEEQPPARDQRLDDREEVFVRGRVRLLGHALRDLHAPVPIGVRSIPMKSRSSLKTSRYCATVPALLLGLWETPLGNVGRRDRVWVAVNERGRSKSRPKLADAGCGGTAASASSTAPSTSAVDASSPSASSVASSSSALDARCRSAPTRTGTWATTIGIPRDPARTSLVQQSGSEPGEDVAQVVTKGPGPLRHPSPGWPGYLEVCPRKASGGTTRGECPRPIRSRARTRRRVGDLGELLSTRSRPDLA